MAASNSPTVSSVRSDHNSAGFRRQLTMDDRITVAQGLATEVNPPGLGMG